MTSDNCTCIAELLATGAELGVDHQRHIEHCPECADIADVSQLIARAGSARGPVDPTIGFQARMVARAGERIVVRRRRRMIASTGAVACAAVAVVGIVWLPGVTRENDTVSAIRPTLPTPVAEQSTEQSTELSNDQSADQSALDTLDPQERELMRLSAVEEALSFRADRRAAGGDASAEDIGRAADALALDDRQRRRLRAIIDKQNQAERDIATAIAAANRKLRDKLAADEPDEGAVTRLIEQISDLEAQMRKSRVTSWLRARKLLSAEQRSSLARRRVPGPHRHATTPRTPHAHDGNADGDSEHSFDIEVDVEMKDLDRMFDDGELERKMLEGLEAAEAQLQHLPEEMRQEMKRARRDFEKARGEIRREMERARRELQRRHRRQRERATQGSRGLSREQRQRIERDTRTHARAAREHAKREIERAREQAKRAADRARVEMQRAHEELERANAELERMRDDVKREREDREDRERGRGDSDDEDGDDESPERRRI